MEEEKKEEEEVEEGKDGRGSGIEYQTTLTREGPTTIQQSELLWTGAFNRFDK